MELLLLLFWAIGIVYWVVSAFFVKKTVVRKSWNTYRIAMIVSGLGLFAFIKLGVRSGLFAATTLWGPQFSTQFVGCSILFFGLLIVLWARMTLGRNWSADIVLKEQQELVVNGPYAFVRHPIYSGILLMGFGTALFYGNILGFFVLAGLAVSFWEKLGLEEKLLETEFPAAYERYKDSVKALIPGVL